MHKCLLIGEVLSIVFSSIQDLAGHLPWKGSRDLVSLAITCKAFSNPALDVLWHSQSSLYFLLHVLPEDAFANANRKVSSLLLIRWPTQKEYERLLFYSRRIREIQPSYGSDKEIHNSTLSILLVTQTLYGLPLLPKLKLLVHHHVAFHSQAVYPRLTIVPGLRGLVICEPTEWRSSWENIAVLVKPYAPAFHTFEIQTYLGSQEIMRLGSPAPILDLLTNFYHLRTLYIRHFDLTVPVLLHVATSLPELRRLSFGVLAKDLEEFNIVCPPVNRFPNLVDLCVDVNSLVACTGFLVQMAFKKLNTLEVMQSVGGSDWDFEPFFRGLSSALPALKTLRLRRNIIGEDVMELEMTLRGLVPVILTLTTLAPLIHLSQLTHISIEGFNLQLQLRDEDIDTLARAWPQLRTLKLMEATLDIPPTLTLTGLLRLVHLCPHLSDLTIRIDCGLLPMFADTGPVLAPAVKSLHFCTSRVELKDGHALAALLHLAFPGLRRLKFAWTYTYSSAFVLLSEEEKRNGDVWKRVNEVWEMVRPLSGVGAR